MAHMDAPRRIGEHFEDVIFFARIGIVGLEDLVFIPFLLPAGLGIARIITFGGHSIRISGKSGELVETFTMASIYDLDITGFTQGQLDAALTGVELVLGAMTAAGSALGSISTRIQLQETFVSGLHDSIDSGVGRLVDADMEEESSKLSALQTQQQLAVQSLSIANSSAQNILTLFRS